MFLLKLVDKEVLTLANFGILRYYSPAIPAHFSCSSTFLLELCWSNHGNPWSNEPRGLACWLDSSGPQSCLSPVPFDKHSSPHCKSHNRNLFVFKKIFFWIIWLNIEFEIRDNLGFATSDCLGRTPYSRSKLTIILTKD